MLSSPTGIRVLTVDAPLFREGNAALLATQSDMTVVAEAATGHEAIQPFGAHRPDITLMDLQTPEMNGLREFPEARIIALTTYVVDDGQKADNPGPIRITLR
ncbi:MAG TPA: response regulator transcription factor [Vicinamibacterales bacterium]|nr:response regulator transcription factor [Vicinamibacterales bacterium]